MLLDAGGARMRQRDDWNRQSPSAETFIAEVDAAVDAAMRKLEAPTVRVTVTETHNGEACDCIDKEMVLSVGSEIELEHVCHDGRVDKVIARVLSIDVPAPPPEHGTARHAGP